jgi:hypothetical protein
MLLFDKWISPGETNWNVLGIKELDSALNLILGTESQNCSSPIPYSSRESAINTTHAVILVKAVRKFSHKIDQGTVKIPEHTESWQMPIDIVLHIYPPKYIFVIPITSTLNYTQNQAVILPFLYQKS